MMTASPPPTLLTPHQWDLLQSVIPPAPPAPPGRGRPPLDNRLIFEAVLYKLISGLPWYDLPARYPSHQTVYRRYRQWLRDGLLDRVSRLIYIDLRNRGGLDLFAALADGRIRLESRGRSFHPVFHPSIESSWQKTTVFILVALLEHRLKPPPNPIHRLRSFPMPETE